MDLPKNVTLDMICDACEADDSTGFCMNCGNEQSGCEPDARKYECDACGAHQVYGAQELVIMFA